jgi:hypothetical protein
MNRLKKIINEILSDTLMYRVCKWVVASSIGLIAIPMTFLILIHTLYPAIFQKEYSDSFRWYKLVEY